MNIETLIKIGGREWIKDDMHRVYFNSSLIEELIGLEISRNRSGKIGSVKLGGEWISNNKGRAIATELDFGRLWFDVKLGEFRQKDMNTIGSLAANAIRAKAAELEIE